MTYTSPGPSGAKDGAPDLALADRKLADLVRDPHALEVLSGVGLNHCCGAHLSLREAAAAAGLALEDVLRALEAPAP